MPLTDATIRNAKPKEKPYKLSDECQFHLIEPVKSINSNGLNVHVLLNTVKNTAVLLLPPS